MYLGLHNGNIYNVATIVSAVKGSSGNQQPLATQKVWSQSRHCRLWLVYLVMHVSLASSPGSTQPFSVACLTLISWVESGDTLRLSIAGRNLRCESQVQKNPPSLGSHQLAVPMVHEEGMTWLCEKQTIHNIITSQTYTTQHTLMGKSTMHINSNKWKHSKRLL